VEPQISQVAARQAATSGGLMAGAARRNEEAAAVDMPTCYSGEIAFSIRHPSLQEAFTLISTLVEPEFLECMNSTSTTPASWPNCRPTPA
jgi:hypothetical protein